MLFVVAIGPPTICSCPLASSPGHASRASCFTRFDQRLHREPYRATNERGVADPQPTRHGKRHVDLAARSLSIAFTDHPGSLGLEQAGHPPGCMVPADQVRLSGSKDRAARRVPLADRITALRYPRSMEDRLISCDPAAEFHPSRKGHSHTRHKSIAQVQLRQAGAGK